ncbi:hypothetical protein D3C73_412810 [compost metagenome]
MVGPMIGWRDEEPLEPAELGNVPRMHPELVQQVQRRNTDEHQQRHADDRHGQVENPAQQKPGTGLAQRRGEVVVLALVVHRMRRPEDVALVAHAMQPVVAEVIKDEGKHPDPHAVGRKLEQRQMFEGKRIGHQAHALGQQARGGREHASADAVDRVRHPIVADPAPTVGQQFDGNQHKEKRHRIQNEVHDAP